MPLYRIELPGSGHPPGNVRADTGKEALRLAMRGAGVLSIRSLWTWPKCKRIGP